MAVGDYCVLCGSSITNLTEEQSRVRKWATYDGKPHGWLHACRPCQRKLRPIVAAQVDAIRTAERDEARAPLDGERARSAALQSQVEWLRILLLRTREFGVDQRWLQLNEAGAKLLIDIKTALAASPEVQP